MLPSCIAGVEVVVADSALAFGRHTHAQFGIGLIERGAQRSASGRGPVEAGPGDVITVNPGEVHDGKPLDAAGRRWRMLYIDPHRMREIVADIPHGQGFEFTAPVIRDALLAQTLRGVLDAITAGSHAKMASEAALLGLVAGQLRPARPGRPALVAGVLAARERIDDDPTFTPTLAALAADAGLSRLQFLRAFARLTGLPPHAYLLQRRTRHARQLVGAGLALAEAAAASGFADQSHMTRCFVRQYGLTPGAFAPA